MPTGPLTLSSLLSGAKKVVANSHFGEKIVAGLMNTAAGTMKPSPLGLPSRFQGPRAPATPNPTIDPVAQLLSAPPKATTAKKLAAAREANAAEQFPAVYKNSQTAGGSRPSLEEVKTALKGSLQDVFTLGDVTSKMASPFVYPVARSIKETAAKPFIPSQTTTGGFLTPDYSVPQFNLLTNLKRAGAKVADGIARGASVAYDELVTQPMAAAAQPDMPPSETSYSIMRGGIRGEEHPNPDYFDWLKSHGYDPMMGRDQVVRMETRRQQRAAEQARRAMDQGAIADPELQAIATTQEAKSSLPTDTPVTRMNRAAGFEEIPTVSEETQRAGYGEGAGLIAEMLNPLSWIDALDPVGGLLHYRRAAKNVARDASAGRGLVANLPKYEGVGAGKVPFQGMPLSRRHNHADATPATPPSAPADPVRTLLSPGPVPTPHSPILGPLPGAPKTDVVAEHEWLSAAREAVGGGATVPQVAEHLGVTEEEAAHLVARVTPAAAPPGYKGIMQAPRPGASADPVADLLAPITPPTGLAPQGRMLFASPEAKAAGMALAKQAAQAMPAAPVADPVAELLAPSAPLSAPTPAPPAMRAANGAPMQAPPATGPTQDAMPPAAPYAPSVPPSPAAPPVAPVASAAPVEPPAVAPQAMPPAAAVPTPPVEPPPPPKPVVTPVAPERSRFAPSKPVAPAPRVQEAPPVQAALPEGQRAVAASSNAPAAPAYAPVDVPGVREPVAPAAPAVGAGTAAPPGVATPSPAAAMAAKIRGMGETQRNRFIAMLPEGERRNVIAALNGPRGVKPRYSEPRANFADTSRPWEVKPVLNVDDADHARDITQGVLRVRIEQAADSIGRATTSRGIERATERFQKMIEEGAANHPLWKSVHDVVGSRPVEGELRNAAAFLRGEGHQEVLSKLEQRWGDDWMNTGGEIHDGEAILDVPTPPLWQKPGMENLRAKAMQNLQDAVNNVTDGAGYVDLSPHGIEVRINEEVLHAAGQAPNNRYSGGANGRNRNAGGTQVGFLGITPQLVESAGREVGNALKSLEKAAEDFVSSKAPAVAGAFSPQTRRVAQKAKEAVQYWTRKSMLTDNVQDAERLTDLLEGVADSSAGIARRAKDDWAPLRDLPKDVQTEVVAALRDPAKMAALVASNPEVGAMASKARGKITDLTQQVLRQQFGVEEATWAALSTQEKKILDEALRNENTLLPNRQMAVLTDLSRAKLIASGALRPVPGKKGRYEFKDQMLSTSEALDNADAYLQRKYAAFEGGRGAATPEAIIAKHPNLTDDEKTRIYELLGNSQSSAGDPRTLRERGMLLARQNISPALRAALGELTGDAGYLVPKTIQDMEKHVALSQTREAIAGNSNWVAPIDETPEAAAARWGVQPTRLSEDVTRNGLLAGRWVHPEVADVLQAQWGFHNPGAAAEAMRGLVGKWKWAKTVANPASHARQWVQNSVAFDLAAGGWIDGVRRTRDAIGEIAQQGPLYKEARDAGLLRGNFHDAELSRVMHQEALKLEPGPDGMLGHLGSFGELLHTLGGKADRAWQIADEATQVGLFGWAREQGMTAQQAVRYVRDVTYDSSSMSRLERLMSGRGAASTMTKPGTVTKALDALTLVANAPFAMSSLYGLRRGAKSLLGIGHNHWMPLTDPALAFRASKYWVLPTLAASAAGAAVMESRPDYEQPLLDNQLPKTVPLPSQVSAFLGEDGKPNFLDIGAFVPWGEAARAVYDTSKLSGEHDPQSMNPLQHAAAMATGGAMSMVRGGLNPILQTGVDIAQNRDTFSGKPVYNPSMGGREILSKSLGQATRNLLPDFTPGIPAALASGDVRDLIKEGGAGFAKLGAGAYNFAADRYSDATGQAVDHMADYRFRDQSLPRALLSTLLGVRTYDGDAEKNATFRETDRKSAVAEENKNYRRLLRQPQRTDAQRADDEKRHLQRLKNIATGGPQKWRGATPNADTLRGLLGL